MAIDYRGTSPPTESIKLYEPYSYAPGSRELYLSTDELRYAQLGFLITANSITIPSDRRLLVDDSFTGDPDKPSVHNRTEETHG